MNPDSNEPQEEQGMPQAPQTGSGEMPEAPAPTVPPQEDGAQDTPEPNAPEEEGADEVETPPLGEGDKDDDGGKW